MKIPFFATILTLAGVIILCGLGVWQVQRLQEKNTLIASIERENDVPIMRERIAIQDLVPTEEFKRGYIVGEYMHYKSLKIIPRMHEGVPGYHLYTAMRFPGISGKVLIVNRGWVPNEDVMPKEASIDRPAGLIKIGGAIRTFPEKNKFTPENDPEGDVWYHPDAEEIAKDQGFTEVFPVIFQAEQEGARTFSEDSLNYPLPVSLESLMPRNNHAQYAFFWFTMALVLVIIYGVRFIVPQFKVSDKNKVD